MGFKRGPRRTQVDQKHIIVVTRYLKILFFGKEFDSFEMIICMRANSRSPQIGTPAWRGMNSDQLDISEGSLRVGLALILMSFFPIS